MGLRLQIVLALAGLLLLAFGPLFFAVASLTRATVLDSREQADVALARAFAAHLSEARASADPGALDRALRVHGRRRDVRAMCVFGADGARLSCEGSSRDVAALRAPEPVGAAGARALRDGTFEVDAPCADGALVARFHLDDDTARGAALVRLVALYMSVFALALVVFAYFALTRLIVRPVDDLVASANRVASGARTLRVPRTGARELIELGASVQAMAEKLISEEASLLLKVEELTETTTRLTQTQAQLVRSERMASVGRLAAGVAHEVGNPLAALMGMQDLLLDDDLPADTQRDFLQRMRRETERIHAVVRDLLDFARPEGDAALPAAPLPPAEVSTVFGDVQSLVRTQRTFRDVRVETEIVGAPHVALPAPRLTQVVLNMVLNASAAITSAGRSNGRVTLRARAVGARRIRIEIEDDGPGVAEAVRERLFEPFATTKPMGEGTGLGLAVCRGLVESAGGEIALDASYTGGARFVVDLPSGEAPSA